MTSEMGIEYTKDEESGKIHLLGVSYSGPEPVATLEKRARVAAMREQNEERNKRRKDAVMRDVLERQARLEALRQGHKAGSVSDRGPYPRPAVHTMVLLYGKRGHHFHFAWVQQSAFLTCITTCTMSYVWRNLDGEDKTVVQVGVSVCNPETDDIVEKKGYALAAQRAIMATSRDQGINVPAKGLSDKARRNLAHRVRVALYLIFDQGQMGTWLF